MFHYLGVIFTIWFANWVLMPLMWPSWPLGRINTYVLQEHAAQVDGTNTTLTLAVDNFHLQSAFKLYPIYPYKDISRKFFEKWIEEQVEISFEKILQNIGDVNWSPDLIGKNVSAGAVIASPSRSHPDYFYQWIRDGAITLNSVTNFLSDIDAFQNKSLQLTIENYLNNSYHLQRIDNPSGHYDFKLRNLGEPKFEVDSTPFLQHWGRPQNDGPPLRVIAVENFMKNMRIFDAPLIQTDTFGSLEEVYRKIIKLDLEYICRYWNEKNFDLWEEIDSFHFFTSLTQLKALKIGLKLFSSFGDTDTDFGKMLEKEYNGLYNFIYRDAGFVNYNLNHIVETPSILDRRSGLDAATLIGSLLTHDDDDDVIPFDITDGLVLNSLSEMIKSMKYLYPINHERLNLNLGVALGRYPEDVYDGTGITEGNPWFLTTLAASELMFKMINRLYDTKEDLIIDHSNQRFYFGHIIEMAEPFELISSTLSDYNELELRIPYNSLAFNQTMTNIFKYGDSFMDVVREHVANDGSMSEQFNKYNGYMQGAENLTWSYGSFWSTYRWRKRALQVMDK
jgi:glucoamylase